MAVSAERREGDVSLPSQQHCFLFMGYTQGKKGQHEVSTLEHSHRKPTGCWGLLEIFLLPLVIFSVFVSGVVTSN